MDLIASILRKLPKFKGKERVARALLKRDILSKRDFWVKGKFDCEYLVPNISENIGFEIFTNGIYEQKTSDFILKKLTANSVFLDLGANIGAISIPIYKMRKDIRIVGVEASPWVYKFLQQNLKHNNADAVITVNKALFYTDDESLGFYSPAGKFGKGSLSPVFTDEAVMVSTIRLDTLLKHLGLHQVDFIKIDVEGYEGHVFKGAGELLSRSDAPDILFEFVDWAEKATGEKNLGSSQELLRDYGYRIYYFKETGKMKEVEGILRKGFYMLYATKKKLNN